MCMAWLQATGQAKPRSIRPSHSQANVMASLMALAWPVFLKSQSHWPRPWPDYKAMLGKLPYKEWLNTRHFFSTAFPFPLLITLRFLFAQVHVTNVATSTNTAICHDIMPNTCCSCCPLFPQVITCRSIARFFPLALNSHNTHSSHTVAAIHAIPLFSVFRTRNVHSRNHKKTRQGCLRSVKFFVRCRTKGIQGRQNLVCHEQPRR